MTYYKVDLETNNKFSQYPITMYYKGDFPRFIRFYKTRSQFRYSEETMDNFPVQMTEITKEEWNQALQQCIDVMTKEMI